MTAWHSYPQIYALGHAAVKTLFDGPVIVQEKIDGSQFSFGVIDGTLRVKSKGQEMSPAAPEKLFARAVATAVSLQDKLVPGWVYRGEVLDKPKHNVLAYDRVPKGNVILFDINDAEESYLEYGAFENEARRLGLEHVRIFEIAGGLPMGIDYLRSLLEEISALGGQKVEGVVVKSLTQYGHDKKRLMGKYVSEAYKETHKTQWQVGPGFLESLVGAFKTDARWQKAVIHLRERGLLQGAPQDIPLLMREVAEDLWKEEGESIRERLFEHYKRDVQRGVLSGMPEWYKRQLLAQQFE